MINLITNKWRIFRRMSAILASLALLLFSAVFSYATPIAGPATITGEVDAMPEGGMARSSEAFSKISGEIVKIDEWGEMPYIRIEEAEGGETDFVIEAGMTVASDLSGLIDLKSLVAGQKAEV
jgi:hypothetical protein